MQAVHISTLKADF